MRSPGDAPAPARERLRGLLGGLGTALAIVAGAAGGTAVAQAPDPGIRGTVLGPDGAPLAGVEVMLHRMTDTTGGLVARESTDSAGRFAFPVADRQGAVLFAAASRDGVLYVGPVLAPEAPLPDDYQIRITGAAETGSIVLEDGTVMPPAAFSGALVETPPPPTSGDRDARRTTLVFLGLASMLAAFAFVWRDRARARSWRAAILELAELGADPEAGVAHRERVAELRERAHALRPR